VVQPLEAFKIWNGGMSFHGGMIGVAVAMIAFARVRKFEVLRLSDLVCAAAPIGLFFGRIANFINLELIGKPTTVPWGVVLPDGLAKLRHPSQIYEALLEGLLLFIILWVMIRRPSVQARPGLVTASFLVLYAAFRSFCELFRQPDQQIGLISGMLSMGQVLCIPMAIIGLALGFYAWRTKSAAAPAQ
jgi:phosphatidylglycerol:prolipoprotein diacylglycerol transferase